MDKEKLKLLEISDELNSITDLDILLKKILKIARKFTGADAGSIMTVSNRGKLNLQYVQNDTLARKGIFKKENILVHQTLDINSNSIVGYAAQKKEPVLVKDAYNISPGRPFSFNRSFDQKTSYKTQSILALPLLTNKNVLQGVMEIINKKDRNGHTVPFDSQDLLYGKHFCNIAAGAIERASLTREIILRMINMAEIRDPKETGPHVSRVGAYSVSLYSRWAKQNNLSESKRKKMEDNLRLGAMLHDLGKVGIPDKILKKPGKLTPGERRKMKHHTIIGARLFKNKTSRLDKIAAEIALNHHEKWDGSGYPGKIDNIYSDKVKISSTGKSKTEIPLTGRIVAIADVYDALISKRKYKDGWPEDKVLEHIKDQAGKSFDPELVDCFMDIQDTVKTIREKFNN
ncbi:MAG: HD domain-containing phosphohydrolase [Elusimicrobiota bacterium]